MFKCSAQCTVLEDSPIRYPTIAANIHEFVVCINNSQEDNTEVIEIVRPTIVWGLYHDVLAIHCPNAVRKIENSTAHISCVPHATTQAELGICSIALL